MKKLKMEKLFIFSKRIFFSLSLSFFTRKIIRNKKGKIFIYERWQKELL